MHPFLCFPHRQTNWMRFFFTSLHYLYWLYSQKNQISSPNFENYSSISRILYLGFFIVPNISLCPLIWVQKYLLYCSRRSDALQSISMCSISFSICFCNPFSNLPQIQLFLCSFSFYFWHILVSVSCIFCFLIFFFLR